MSLTAGKFRDAAMSGEAAFRELKEVAGTARESLGGTTHRANTTWQMLREVQDNLRDLARNDELQTTEVSKLVQAFDTIGVALGALIRELYSLGTHLRQRDANDPEAASLLAALQNRLVESPTGLTGDDRRGTTRHSRARLVGELDRPRPWWRRIFG